MEISPVLSVLKGCERDPWERHLAVERLHLVLGRVDDAAAADREETGGNQRQDGRTEGTHRLILAHVPLRSWGLGLAALTVPGLAPAVDYNRDSS